MKNYEMINLVADVICEMMKVGEFEWEMLKNVRMMWVEFEDDDNYYELCACVRKMMPWYHMLKHDHVEKSELDVWNEKIESGEYTCKTVFFSNGDYYKWLERV